MQKDIIGCGRNYIGETRGGNTKYSQGISVGNPEGKKPLEDVDVDER